jgi:hypothetical protein
LSNNTLSKKEINNINYEPLEIISKKLFDENTGGTSGGVALGIPRSIAVINLKRFQR